MSVAEKMTAIADAIRGKTGKTEKLSLDEMAAEINEISTGERDINPEWTDWKYFCYKRDDLASKLRYSDTSNGTNFQFMFNNCVELTSVPLFDTSNGTDFRSMFSSCQALTSVPLFDTSNGTDFGSMFNDCRVLTSVPALDTSNGTAFGAMFSWCFALTSVPALDTSNGTTFGYMFEYCEVLTSIPAIDTSNGTNFGSMFSNCKALTSVPQLDLTKATSSSALTNIFYYCTSLTDLNIVGTINATNLNVQYSPLSHDSLMTIINALADKTGVSGTWKVTLGADNLTKLTAEEIAIAEGKGWTLA